MNYLLTLDLASRIGWSCGHPADQSFASGAHQLPKTGEDIGAFLHHFRQWLQPTLKGVSLCVFESPILPRTTTLATARKLYGQAGYTELACRDFGIKCMEVNNMTIKKFMGSGGYSKTDMIRAVKTYGYEPETDDEADAIAIRLFAIAKLFPKETANFSLDMGELGVAADRG